MLHDNEYDEVIKAKEQRLVQEFKAKDDASYREFKRNMKRYIQEKKK